MSNDTPGNVPESVTIIFPRTDYDALTGVPYPVIVTLASLELEDYENEYGRDGTHLVLAATVANFTTAVTPDNDAEINLLAEQIATDFYIWRLASLEVHYKSVVPWISDGMHDVEYKHLASGIETIINRSEWDIDFGRSMNSGTHGTVPDVITIISGDGTINITYPGPGIIDIGVDLGPHVPICVKLCDNSCITLYWPEMYVGGICGGGSGSGSGGGSGGDSITVACCALPIPLDLCLTLTGSAGCACANGSQVVIAWDGVQQWWQGTLTMGSCGHTRGFRVKCTGLIWQWQYSLCDQPGNWSPWLGFSVIDCDPFTLITALWTEPINPVGNNGGCCNGSTIGYWKITVTDNPNCSGPPSPTDIESEGLGTVISSPEPHPGDVTLSVTMSDDGLLVVNAAVNGLAANAAPSALVVTNTTTATAMTAANTEVPITFESAKLTANQFCMILAAGTYSLRLTWSGGGADGVACYAGMQAIGVYGLTNDAVDTSARASSVTGVSTTPSAGNLVTTVAAEYLQGFVATMGPLTDDDGLWDNGFIDGGQDAGGSAYTGASIECNLRMCEGFRITSATGTYTPAKTAITARSWIAMGVAFK